MSPGNLDSFYIFLPDFWCLLFYFSCLIALVKIAITSENGQSVFPHPRGKLWFLVIYSACWYCLFFSIALVMTIFLLKILLYTQFDLPPATGENKKTCFICIPQAAYIWVCVFLSFFYFFVLFSTWSFSLPRWSHAAVTVLTE